VPGYSLRHLSNDTLRATLRSTIARERGFTALVLAHIAEFDARRLHLEDGYPSMYAYCVGDLGLSEEAAFKRIHAARAAYRFPEIFAMVADGRLHLSAVVTLAPHLTETAAAELLAAAAHRTRKAIERLLAERFPRPDLPTVLQAPEPAAGGTDSGNLHAPGRVDGDPVPAVAAPEPPTSALVPMVLAAEPPIRSRVIPLAPGRVRLQTTVDLETEDLVREAHELLGHPTATSHVPEVLKAAMRLYVERLRKQKFAETDAPRPGRPRSEDSRHVPAAVKRAVHERDHGRCTYVSPTGHRCEERSGLELDHIVPYAQGGEASVSNLRLRCHAHNQYEAERVYGASFMKNKRTARRQARGETAKEEWLTR
jgi:hypothetical protein